MDLSDRGKKQSKQSLQFVGALINISNENMLEELTRETNKTTLLVIDQYFKSSRDLQLREKVH